jgi:hypothetical protein
MLFGSIGLGFFLYGRKQKVMMPYFCGLALMIYRYFVSNASVSVGIGCALILLPYFIKF